jgi:signal peptidase II
MVRTKAVLVGLIVMIVMTLDLATKRWALLELADGRSLEVLGGLVPITLTFNQGAAFGLSIGNYSRFFFLSVTLLAIGFLLMMIWQSGPAEKARICAAALVLGGALGNLYDRVRWDRGVVDFIGPIGLGFMDWPIFNVADSAITCGAIIMGISFLREDWRNRREAVGD